MANDKWIVVPYIKCAVVRESDFGQSGVFERDCAFGLDEDEANALCEKLNATRCGLDTSFNVVDKIIVQSEVKKILDDLKNK